MAEDIKKKEQEKEEKEKEEKTKTTFLQRVPGIWKVGGILLIFVKLMQLSKEGGNINELWLWVVGVLVVWYFLGTDVKRQETVLLTPKEAEDSLWKEINRKVREGQIPRSAQIHVGPNNGIFEYEGRPKHYIIAVKVLIDNRWHHKRGTVYAEGNARGFATIQGHPGEVQGSEAIPVKTPALFKKIKEWDLDYKDFLPDIKVK